MFCNSSTFGLSESCSLVSSLLSSPPLNIEKTEDKPSPILLNANQTPVFNQICETILFHITKLKVSF
ncbi:MAG: hypothetical protein LBQ59_05070 [Candidatus Peribacteria bacterium]|jgi:hypothetical protein|nr:hypothetical protein [Candidatus Peribacteria bacterium]